RKDESRIPIIRRYGIYYQYIAAFHVYLESSINQSTIQTRLGVENDTVVAFYFLIIKFKELIVRYGHNNGIIYNRAVHLIKDFKAVFMFHFHGVSPWVINVNLQAEGNQLMVDVNHTCITDVRTVLFKGDAHDQCTGIFDLMVLLDHKFDHFVSDKSAHL